VFPEGESATADEHQQRVFKDLALLHSREQPANTCVEHTDLGGIGDAI
jgi:hypothetical protein